MLYGSHFGGNFQIFESSRIEDIPTTIERLGHAVYMPGDGLLIPLGGGSSAEITFNGKSFTNGDIPPPELIKINTLKIKTIKENRGYPTYTNNHELITNLTTFYKFLNLNGWFSIKEIKIIGTYIELDQYINENF